MPELIQVHFRRSPTGAPFFLAYSEGEFGWVRPQKAKALLDAGMIDPVKIAQPLPEKKYTPSKSIEAPEVKLPDLSTYEGVQEKFGTDIEAMRAYCEENGIEVHHAVKRPETLWKHIYKHNAK